MANKSDSSVLTSTRKFFARNGSWIEKKSSGFLSKSSELEPPYTKEDCSFYLELESCNLKTHGKDMSRFHIEMLCKKCK